MIKVSSQEKYVEMIDGYAYKARSLGNIKEMLLDLKGDIDPIRQ